MYKIYIFIFSTLLLSCTTKIRYIGKSHAPTKDIDVFVSEQSIKQPYEFIGKGYVGGIGMQSNQEKIQKKAEQLGLKKGADAVLITDYYISNTGGTDIASVYRTDSVARGLVTTGHTRINTTTASGYTILYLKYTQ